MFMQIGLCVAASALTAGPHRYEANWESLDARPTPAWFAEAKFGIFIHWGVYSVPAWAPKGKYAEWYWHDMKDPEKPTHEFHTRIYGPKLEYKAFAKSFKAQLFDPEQWADILLRSGAHYVVLTSKHHDGFCLWSAPDSPDWNSVDVGPHRDLLGDLTKAVHARGLKMGLYYSLYEWFHPLYKSDVKRYVEEHMVPQFKDVVTRYRPSIIFTDGEWDHPDDVWRSRELLAWLFNESPCRDEVVINDRWGKGTRSTHGGYFTTEYGEHTTGTMTAAHPWEENRGIGASFGFNRNEGVEDYQTAKGLIHLLINTVSKGGNLLLDIGPTADGRIPVIMQERLLEMGEWLRLNGEAIYGTHPWRQTADGRQVRYTATNKSVYAICLTWPGPELVLNEPKAGKHTVVRLLGAKGPLKWSTPRGKLTIHVPPLSPDEAPCRHAYVFRLDGVE